MISLLCIFANPDFLKWRSVQFETSKAFYLCICVVFAGFLEFVIMIFGMIEGHIFHEHFVYASIYHLFVCDETDHLDQVIVL